MVYNPIQSPIGCSSPINCERPIVYYGRILLGEINPLLSTMKKAVPRWSSQQHETECDPLVNGLRELQMKIHHLKTGEQIEAAIFLEPFLSIIRSEDTTGPITKSALAAVNRILCYGLLNAESRNAAGTVESIATAVTHAKFVGTDHGADEVVLWEILTVLKTLMIGPVGHLLTNESVCEILNSSFRICFELRLSELLRNCTEEAMREMIQLLFSRLPQFKDDPQIKSHKLKMRTGRAADVKGKKGKSKRHFSIENDSSYCQDDNSKQSTQEMVSLSHNDLSQVKSKNCSTESSLEQTVASSEDNMGIMRVSLDDNSTDEISQYPKNIKNKTSEIPKTLNLKDDNIINENTHEIKSRDVTVDTDFSKEEPTSEEEHISEITVKKNEEGNTSSDSAVIDLLSPCDELDVSHTHLAPENLGSQESLRNSGEDDCYKNNSSKKSISNVFEDRQKSTKKITKSEDFTNSQGVTFSQHANSETFLVPYGLPCVKEVLRFLISLTSPVNQQNTPNMILTALNLLTLALEVGSQSINETPSLMNLIKAALCRHLLMNLKCDVRSHIFMASLRLYTLLFESLRTHLKFQLEMFMTHLTDIVASESQTVSYLHKEQALETILQLWRIPGIISELFLNYDCNLYSANVFENLTKILSKNAFPIQGLYSTNLLSLEALQTVIDTIESHKSSDLVKKSLKVPSMTDGLAPKAPLLEARACLTDSKQVNRDYLLALKEKKKLLSTGTDQLNAKPDKGIQFLRNNNLLGPTFRDVALFFRQNPHLDKKVLGEYISKKKNVEILSAFVKSFDFTGKRIDECLRAFLETFRLPGEAPLISIVIEHFSSHWFESNDSPFEKDDAAFTLAYAVIILNVDQHNQNAKKQNIPMTVDQFCNNLRGVNGGNDFDSTMLQQVFQAVHEEEIVMPAEHSGLVKENYLWKMLLRRGQTEEGEYLLANDNCAFDKDLFALCWSPTIASLSYVFDKSTDDAFVQKALSGFRKCASISARYGMSYVFDSLVISLCKFTTLTVCTTEAAESVAIHFGENKKAQIATRTLFKLITSHADIIREGWKNVLDVMLQLFRCRMLPESFVESEDFVESSGKVSLVRHMPTSIPRVESGLFSSIYSYIALGDSTSTREPSHEDLLLMESAKTWILNCHPEKIITESAFLRYQGLNELLNAMMEASDVGCLAKHIPSNESDLDEHKHAFLLELIVSVLVANKDRAGGVWPGVRDHIYSLLMSAGAGERYFLLERCVVAILRIAKVLLRRPEMANPVLQSLRILLLLKPHILNRIGLQIVSGIHEVVSLNAGHIQNRDDWAILVALLECAGAGAKAPPIVNSFQLPQSANTAKDASFASDTGNGIEKSNDLSNEAEMAPSRDVHQPIGDTTEVIKPIQQSDTINSAGGWILVGREGEIEPIPVKGAPNNEWDIVYDRSFGEHKPEALIKTVDTLSFLVREQHITAINLPSVVRACRTLVEATLHGGIFGRREALKSPSRRRSFRKRESGHRSKSPPGNAYDADESDSDDCPAYQQVSEKLLDLMDTLHTSASHILEIKNQPETIVDLKLKENVSLWQLALCPLLQGIARYCCDIRPSVRNLSMTYLHRALMNHDLQTLTAAEWESCFNKVLFPLLAKLLHSFTENSYSCLDETRFRAATLVQKVFLRHLGPLVSLPTFTALWLTFLDFMDKYLNTHRSEHLGDAIPEILKNMLLVMETTQVFHTQEGFTQLWSITWDRIDSFLPDFRHELFRSHPPSEVQRPPPTGEPKNEAPSSDGELPASTELLNDTLKSQQAARLSLSQESIPLGIERGVILQPPLPHVKSNLSSSAPSENAFPFCDNSTQQSLLSELDTQPSFALPLFLPVQIQQQTLDSSPVASDKDSSLLAETTVVRIADQIPVADFGLPSKPTRDPSTSPAEISDSFQPTSLLFSTNCEQEFTVNCNMHPPKEDSSSTIK